MTGNQPRPSREVAEAARCKKLCISQHYQDLHDKIDGEKAGEQSEVLIGQDCAAENKSNADVSYAAFDDEDGCVAVVHSQSQYRAEEHGAQNEQHGGCGNFSGEVGEPRSNRSESRNKYEDDK